MRVCQLLSQLFAVLILWAHAADCVLAVQDAARSPYDRRAELTTRMEQAARFILERQDENGAMNESGFINTDSNMLYALMGLIAAYDRTGRREYLQAVERGCRWLMQVQTPEGDWYLSYQRKGEQYLPALPASYKDFAAIRGVDTTMALFIHVAHEVEKRTADQKLRDQLRASAQRACRFLITCNLDASDGLFWSSYQLEAGKAGSLSDYRQYRVKYAADNAETYIGLRAAAEMFSDQRAAFHAERLKKNFMRFFDGGKGVYAVMLNHDGKPSMHPAYARWFANGWSAYLMREPTMFALPRAVMAEKIDDHGAFPQWEGTFTLSTLAFLLGEQTSVITTPKTRAAERYLFSMQQANGGLADDAELRSTYVNLAGMYLLYLAQELAD
jgi:hypothetical protein